MTIDAKTLRALPKKQRESFDAATGTVMLFTQFGEPWKRVPLEQALATAERKREARARRKAEREAL